MKRKSRQKVNAAPAPATRPRTPEVVVIGAGVVGAACAASLARRGVRVQVFAHPTRSNTAVSGGHLLLQSKRPGPLLDQARRSLVLLAEFVAGREAELNYQQTGSLLLAVTEAETSALREQFDALRAAGIPVEWLSGDAARNLEPGLSPDVRAATFCPTDAQIDPSALAGAWLQEALANRAVLHGAAPVEAFVTQAGAVCGVVAGGMEYPAAAVVIAAGPWCGELAAMAGVALELRPRRGVLLRTTTADVLAQRPLLSAEYLTAKFAAETEASTSSVTFSFQQHPDGECVLGGSREFVDFDSTVTDDLAAAIVRCGERYLPAVSRLDWTRRDVGFRPWTAQGTPYIGASSVPGVFLACGHEGDGVTLAAITGERVADAVTAALT